MVHLTFPELFLEGLRRVILFGYGVTGILSGQIEAVSWIFLKDLADDCLRGSVVVDGCSVEVVHSVFDGVVHHLLRKLLVN